jgi:hypothetical protein
MGFSIRIYIFWKGDGQNLAYSPNFIRNKECIQVSTAQCSASFISLYNTRNILRSAFTTFCEYSETARSKKLFLEKRSLPCDDVMMWKIRPFQVLLIKWLDSFSYMVKCQLVKQRKLVFS